LLRHRPERHPRRSLSDIPDEALPLFEGLDTLVLDAVRYRPHPNHFHWDRAVEWAERLAPRITYFTHLCDDYDHGPVEAGLPPHLRLAYAGLPPHLRLAYDGLRIPL